MCHCIFGGAKVNWLQELKEGEGVRTMIADYWLKRKRGEVPRGPCLLFVGRCASPKAQIFAFPEDKALNI